MSLSIGNRLGPYEITAQIGTGGMGEVYKARDTRLGRDVAIKVLPDEVSHNPKWLARFQREARVLATLDHQQIAAIYGLEEVEGRQLLVMQLVAGETLRQRISRGSLPADEGLRIALQIAGALEAAHEQGIAHLDLKPSNVMVSEEGVVKVLDFGLAKRLPPPSGSTEFTEQETLSASSNAEGSIVGTTPYMSPELLRGKEVDGRSDIWAFGCVLFEILTGTVLFHRQTQAESWSAILEAEPDWDELASRFSPEVVRIMHWCLRKDPRQRLQHSGDLRLELEEALAALDQEARPGESKHHDSGLRAVLPAALSALVVASFGFGIWWSGWGRPAEPAPVRRFEIAAPASHRLVGPPALSLDGANLVFAAVELASEDHPRESLAQLYIRSMITGKVKPIPGTIRASRPFFSPNDDWVGFFADGEIKKVSLQGGDAVSLSAARFSSDASWGNDGRIYFQPTSEKELTWVAASGGSSTVIETPEIAVLGLDSPTALPTEGELLLRVYSGRPESPLAIFTVDSGKLEILPFRGASPRYVPTGHLVYLRRGALVAVPFDLERRAASGPETPILDGVLDFRFSADGTLVYTPGVVDSTSLFTSVDRTGASEPLGGLSGDFGSFRLSPDGNRLAVEMGGAPISVWLLDLKLGTRTRSTQQGNCGAPAWTPDGSRVSFTSDRNGSIDLFWKKPDVAGCGEPLLVGDQIPAWGAWSPDGRHYAFTEMGSGADIWILPVAGDREPWAFVRSEFSEWGPSFSPDGRWIAYASDESGSYQVYVKPFPDPEGARTMVSLEGGEEPIFSPQGDELFYRNGGSIVAVPVILGSEFESGNPEVLFETDMVDVSGISYDVFPGGDRFVLLKGSQEPETRGPLRAVVNWFEELKRLAPPPP